jgi:hypothetical protein
MRTRGFIAAGAATVAALGLVGAGTAEAAPATGPVQCASNVTAAVLASLTANHVPVTSGQVIQYLQIVVVNGVGAIQSCVVIVP